MNTKQNKSNSLLRAIFGLLLLVSFAFAQKQVYIPRFMTGDPNNASSQWSYERSVQTDNFIIFWEVGYGSTNPSQATGTYKVNMEALKEIAEKSYAFYVDSLRLVIKGSSLTDTYKHMIFIMYTTDWGAYGSGQDERVGSLHLSPSAANIAPVVAHEIGHSFQYMTGVDVKGGGYRWGFGANGAGGNGYWEQGANWKAFNVYPDQWFSSGDFNNYITKNHLHILHESPRYANYFLPEFWAHKRGRYFQGRLWREAIRPEDPVETYKRLNQIDQEAFNDEMFEHAALLTTWDIPSIRARGANYIDRRAQVAMTKVSDDYWIVAPAVAPENYGYNSIKLNAPTTQTQVVVEFQGRAGAVGYRSLNVDKGGWRYGFVAMLSNGTRVYSDMASLRYASGANPKGSLSFTVPANCTKLWLVVSGAPQEHWKHAWDDDNTNDEQWPYEVRFSNTNRLGEPNRVVSITNYTLTTTVNGSGSISPNNGTTHASGSSVTLTATPATGFAFTGWSGDVTGTTNPITLTMNSNKSVAATFAAVPIKTLTYSVTMSPMSDYTASAVSLQADSIARFFNLTPAQIASGLGSTITYYAVNPNGALDATSTAVAPGHWYGSTGQTVAYGDQAYLYSELNLNTMVANIGQYPDRLNTGEQYTIKQALVYRKSATESFQVILVFNVNISSTPVLAQNLNGPRSAFKILQSTMAESLVEYSVESGARMEVYNLRGHQLSSIQVDGHGVKTMSQLGIQNPGIYQILLKNGSRLIASKRVSVIH